jgi:hypothetical protein
VTTLPLDRLDGNYIDSRREGASLGQRFGERSLNPRRDVRRCGGPRHDQNLQAVVVLDGLVLAHLGERCERRSEAVRMDGDLRAR